MKKILVLFVCINFLAACGNEPTFKINQKVAVTGSKQVGVIKEHHCHSLLFEKSVDVCEYTIMFPIDEGGFQTLKISEKLLTPLTSS